MRISLRTQWKPFLVIALGLAITIGAFHGLESSQPLPVAQDDSDRILPKPGMAKVLSLGHAQTLAGIFWINCLVDFGDAMFSGKDFRWLSQYADLVTRLDSLFYMPYYYVGSQIPLESPDTSDVAILRRGYQVYPNDWRLALFLSLRLAQGPAQDPTQAGEIMDAFAHSPDTLLPDYVRHLGQSFQILGMPKRIALSQLLDQYLDPNFQAYRRGTQGKIRKLLGFSPKSAEADSVAEQLKWLSQGKEVTRVYADLLRLGAL
ncbi:MAG TPA: hypothetical protein VLM37_07120 [Fibrobacteraceae bacterium]|nr:hypothetical protein [Fibrobacteraceae bacterium]